MAESAALRAHVDALPEAPDRRRRQLIRLARRPLLLLALAILSVLALGAILAPLIAPYSPYATLKGQELLGPSLRHPFGTDDFGRDLLSRVLFGLRVSFVVGIGAVSVGALVGATIGAIAGYVGHLVDAALMRVIDSLLAVPAILLAIAIVAVWGSGLATLIAAIAVVNIPIFARLSRAGFLSERPREYVTAASSLGATGLRVTTRHILPNVLAPLLLQAALAMAYSVLLEAGLSYLGLGIQPPQSSLGSLLNGSQRFMRDALWYPLFPGMILAALLLSLNALADSVNEVLNPNARR